jgi:sulfate transport system permease protein
VKRATSDHWLARYLCIGMVFAFVLFFLIFPVCVVVIEALRGGLALYWSALIATHSLSAIRLTLLVAVAVVPLNTAFGICAAWAVTHFKFRGKALLISLIEIPLWGTASRSCSPIRPSCWPRPSSRFRLSRAG